MFPRFLFYDCKNAGPRYAVLARQISSAGLIGNLDPCFSGDVPSPYFHDCFKIEFGMWAISAIKIPSSTFLDRILNIVVSVTKKQVVRIHAFSIIAFVKHAQSAVYRAEKMNPGNAMGQEKFFLELNVAVPGLVECSMPIPTSIVTLLCKFGFALFPKSGRWILVSLLNFVHWFKSYTAYKPLQVQ